MTKEKIYKDLLGREIKIDDMVLHLWVNCSGIGRPLDGYLGVKYKIATVYKLNNKSIGISYYQGQKEKHSAVHNTENRIIVMESNKLKINMEDIASKTFKRYESNLKRSRTIQKNLRVRLKESERFGLVLEEENKELKEAIDLLSPNNQRFELLDIREK
jgi:hypothetical protein